MELQASEAERPINGPHSPEPHDALLEESIQRFLCDHRAGITDFSRFTSIFSRLIQQMPDPPLEIVWFYAFASLRVHSSQVPDPFNQVMVTKELLKLLVSFSSPSSRNGSKTIAVLAPVVFELHGLMTDSRYSGFRRDIDCLVEGIVSYISMCCCDGEFEENDGSVRLGRCFEGVVRMWTIDKVEVNAGFGDGLRVFLPLVSDGIRNKVAEGGGVGYLAGVVMFEALLLRLCSKFELAGSMADLEKDVLSWAVNTITGFRNCYFIDTLLRMLLERSLPATSLLSSEGEALFQKVLFNAVIFVESTFFTPRNGIEQHRNHLKDLALTWLFVADKAVQSARENEDETTAISYIHAFSESRLPSQIIEWVSSQAGMEQISRPNVLTPLTIIKWLLLVEDQGGRMSDNDIPSCHARAISYKSRVMSENGQYLFCYSGNETGAGAKADDDEEMVDFVDAGASTTTSTAVDGRRKRKEGRKDDGETRVKFFKVHPCENISERKGFCL